MTCKNIGLPTFGQVGVFLIKYFMNKRRRWNFVAIPFGMKSDIAGDVLQAKMMIVRKEMAVECENCASKKKQADKKEC